MSDLQRTKADLQKVIDLYEGNLAKHEEAKERTAQMLNLCQQYQEYMDDMIKESSEITAKCRKLIEGIDSYTDKQQDAANWWKNG